MAESAISAVVFEDSGDGKLTIQCVLLRNGDNAKRMIDVAQDVFRLFAAEVAKQDCEQLALHNPSEFDA